MISVKEMLEIEKKSIKAGTSVSVLMNNAGRKICDVLNEKFELKGKSILIVAYHGNNGGDGFAAAGFLKEICKVDVLFLGKEEKLSKEAGFYYEKIKDLVVNNKINFNSYDIIIDAMLGTGTKGKIKEPLANAIDNFNNSNAFKVSVDVPTGIDPDTGEILDKAVKPDLVICFYDIKKGLKNIKDKCVAVDIGFIK